MSGRIMTLTITMERSRETNSSEVDITATYAFKLGPVDTSVGAILYAYPTTHPDIIDDAPLLSFPCFIQDLE